VLIFSVFTSLNINTFFATFLHIKTHTFMKKVFFLAIMLPSLVFAQNSFDSKVRKNEITVNAFELVIGGVLPISYERFIDNNQSITVKTFFFDKHYNDFNTGSNNLISLQTQYNFYFSEKKENSGLFFSPFLKFTKGKDSYTFYDYYIDNNGNYIGTTSQKNRDVNALMAGFGLGYKLLLKKRLSLSLSTDIGRVLNEKDYYAQYGPIEARVGVNVGIRF
jgi:Protein of unknown function (DUF3575)